MRHCGTLTALLAAALVCGVIATPSHGAATVIGDGAPRLCFEAAQFKRLTREGIASCTHALNSDLLDHVDRAATFVNRGILKMRLSDFEGALDDYDAGLDLSPNLAEAFLNRGAVLIMMKRYDDAIADFSKAIALGTQEPQIAYYDRGLVYERIGDLTGACADYRQALTLQPNFVLASDRLDICHFHGNSRRT